MALPEQSPDSMMGMEGMEGMESGAPASETTSMQVPAGDIEAARTQVITAKKTLEPLISVFGSDTDMGKSVMDALRALGKAFPADSAAAELTNAETANMVTNLPQQDKMAITPELLGAAPGMSEQIPPELAGAGAQQIPPELLGQ